MDLEAEFFIKRRGCTWVYRKTEYVEPGQTLESDFFRLTRPVSFSVSNEGDCANISVESEGGHFGFEASVMNDEGVDSANPRFTLLVNGQETLNLWRRNRGISFRMVSGISQDVSGEKLDIAHFLK